MNIEKIWNAQEEARDFSGVFSVRDESGIIFEKCCGFRNRGERLLNNSGTAFGIASGTKFFTALAVCKLIDKGLLSLNDKLWDLLPYDLGEIDKNVTIIHLLTHTSGIGDYLDEEDPNSYEKEQELCNKYPVYLWEDLSYYLPMITPLIKKFEPGQRFGYSNAGFVMLGLAVEAVTRKTYQQYVEDEIITPLKLRHTGFYPMNALPFNTAYGYMGEKTNIFSLPIVGGSDGGIFTCAEDLDILWRSVFSGKLLSEKMLSDFLKPHVTDDYGLGVYCREKNGETAYYAVGGDFGVDFFTVYFPRLKITASALGNTEVNTYPLLEALLSSLL